MKQHLHHAPNAALHPISRPRPLTAVPLLPPLHLVLLGRGQTGKRPTGRDSPHSLPLLGLQHGEEEEEEEEGQGRRAAPTSPGDAVWDVGSHGRPRSPEGRAPR